MYSSASGDNSREFQTPKIFPVALLLYTW